MTVADPNGVEASQSGVVRTGDFYINGKDCDRARPNAILVVAEDGTVSVDYPANRYFPTTTTV